MKYVCKICGYVYDDQKEKVPFSELPEDLKCPVCKASKDKFEKSIDVTEEKTEIKKVEIKDNDLERLSVYEFSALCSNLARGCEKQYKTEESNAYKALADYFEKIIPEEKSATVDRLTNLLSNDLTDGYKTLNSVGKADKDRGALRVSVWGEKVSNMMMSLIEQYEKEGEEMLKNTNIYVCTVCGFIYVGNNPPALCPVCKVPDWKFEKIGG